MRKIFYAATIALVCVRAGNATAGVTGQDCHVMSEVERGFYMFGFVDGISASKVLGLPEEIGDQLWECLDEKTAGQLSAVLKKYLDETSEIWNELCFLSAIGAIVAMCGLFPKETAGWEGADGMRH